MDSYFVTWKVPVQFLCCCDLRVLPCFILKTVYLAGENGMLCISQCGQGVQ
jgi:hypothetical protein